MKLVMEKRMTRKFLVMDGSSRKFMNEITALTEMITSNTTTFKRLFNVDVNALDGQHPTMKVVSVKCYRNDFMELRKFMMERFPEQCVFGVPL